jgi:prepilin-type N-terminal cleavage/methylation domain-containing protein
MTRDYFKKQNTDSGFTLIELLIASAVFSILLVVFLAAFIQISRLFYKGVSISSNQESSRNVVQAISDDLRFTLSPPQVNTTSTHDFTPDQGFFCIAQHRYLYAKKFHVGSGPGYGLLRQNMSNKVCMPPALDGTANGSSIVAGSNFELISDGNQLNNLNVPCSTTDQTCTVSVMIVFYGDDTDVFEGGPLGYQSPTAVCKGALTNNQFCSTAYYSTTVLQN